MDQFQPRYADYETWYLAARNGFLEPARVTAVRLLNELLDTRVDSLDRERFRISMSRVKSTQRSFAKLGRDKYLGQACSFEEIPNVIDDLVGLRVVCNNLSDINTFQELAGELPLDNENAMSLAVERDSHRDYFSNPKPSGYRAYHVNLVVPVPTTTGFRRVRVEVQVRTLLQDGWGELTHEDTYKPGSSVPDWIVGMSLRMAELLAAVDNIAQDLRTGLDVETQRAVLAVAEGPEPSVAYIDSGGAELVIPTPGDVKRQATRRDSAPITPKPSAGVDREIGSALSKETVALVGALTKPVALAVLSQRLTAIFGNEITKTWAQFGGFKRFLEATVPNAKLSGPSPGYIHPIDAEIPEEWTTEDTGSGAVPEIVRELRTYDKAIPLVGSERIDQVIRAVGSALRSSDALRIQGNNAAVSEIEALARQSRQDAESRGQLVVRPHAVYILQVLNREGFISAETSDAQIRATLFNRIMSSAEMNSLTSDNATSEIEVRDWLGIGP